MGGRSTRGSNRHEAGGHGESRRRLPAVLVVTVALVTVVLATAGGTAAADDVITVDDDGGGDYESLPNAVQNASDGDTIRVAPGRYDPITVDKDVTIVGDPGDDSAGPGPDAPVLSTRTDRFGFTRRSIDLAAGGAGTTIRGFNLTSGVRIHTARKLTFADNHIDSIYSDTTGLEMVDTTVRRNQVNSVFSGRDSSYVRSRNVTITDNTAADPDLGYTFEADIGATSGHVSDVIFRRNNGLLSVYNGDGQVEDVVVSANRIQGTVSIDGATLRNVTVTENDGRNVEISIGNPYYYGSNAALADIVVSNNDFDSGTPDRGVRIEGKYDTVGVVRVVNNELHDGVGVSLAGDGESLDSTSGAVTVSGNVVRGTDGGHPAVTVDAYRLSLKRIRIANNHLLDSSGDGIKFDAGQDFDTPDRTDIRSVKIVDNEVRDPADVGVWIDLNYNVTGDAGIDDLQLTDNGLRKTGLFGIRFTTTGGARSVTIGRNLVADVGGREFNQGPVGIRISTGTDDEVAGASGRSDIRLVRNLVDSTRMGLVIGQEAPASLTVRENQFSNVERGVYVWLFGTNDPDLSGVEFRRNEFLGTGEYGILSETSAVIDARRNYWDALDGPASPAGGPTLADPVTGALANGTGGTVGAAPDTDGVSNVRFDPFLGDPLDIEVGPAADVPADEPAPPDAATTPDEPAPAFEFTGSATPDVVVADEPVNVSLTVRNTGDAAGRYDTTLETGFRRLTGLEGDMAPGETAHHTVTVRFDDISVNQLFAGGDYVDRVRIQPLNASLERQRHLRVEAAYTDRLAVTGGAVVETVAVLRNTDSETREFLVPFNVTRTTDSATAARSVAGRTETVMLQPNETQVTRYATRIPGAVSGPHVATAFVDGVPAGNLTVLPERDRPHGLTHAYATPHGTVSADPYEVVLVAHNNNDTAETFTWILMPPGVGPETPPEVRATRMRIESVTVPPGGSRRLRFGVEQAVASTAEGPRYWRADGVPAPLVGGPPDDADDE
jgi:hypothetical protein